MYTQHPIAIIILHLNYYGKKIFNWVNYLWCYSNIIMLFIMSQWMEWMVSQNAVYILTLFLMSVRCCWCTHVYSYSVHAFISKFLSDISNWILLKLTIRFVDCRSAFLILAFSKKEKKYTSYYHVYLCICITSTERHIVDDNDDKRWRGDQMDGE